MFAERGVSHHQDAAENRLSTQLGLPWKPKLSSRLCLLHQYVTDNLFPESFYKSSENVRLYYY